jgi:serine/alanine adding enzyme
MTINIKTLDSIESCIWDAYVKNHPNATLYHLSGWKKVIENTYGHKTYYLMAINEDRSAHRSLLTAHKVVGILPLVHLKHFLFGNSFISLPFFDLSGILSDNFEIEKLLLDEAIKLGKRHRVDFIELRHSHPLKSLNPANSVKSSAPIAFERKSHKVRMLLELPGNSKTLMKSFKSKLRSQIKRPQKEGLITKTGGIDLLKDFYNVFAENMKGLGSPVHSKKMIKIVLEEFPDDAEVILVKKDKQALAGSIIIGFRETLQNPWASSLREYSKLSPNMLLYWSMLKYACDNGFNLFDFGRCSIDEGTYKFKKQWGAQPQPLYWYYISLNGKPLNIKFSDKLKHDSAIRYWQKLPVPVTKIIGPMIRKHISL